MCVASSSSRACAAPRDLGRSRGATESSRYRPSTASPVRPTPARRERPRPRGTIGAAMEVMERLVAEIERNFAEVERTLEDPALPQDQRRYADVGRQYARLSDTIALTRRWREAQQQVAGGAGAAGGRDRRGHARLPARAAGVGARGPARARGADPRRDPGARPGRREERDRRDPRGHRRRGGGAVRGRPLPHVHALRRAPRLEGRGALDERRRTSGGFKEVTFEVRGRRRVLRASSASRGVHRVQRVPATETQGRIHTSTATVAVLPEAEEVDVDVDPKDVRDRHLPLGRRRRPEREHDATRRCA